MIVQKDFLNKLKDFGLNTYESKLWTALLSRGVSTAGELSDIANVPRSRSYDVLESLERKGFIIMKLGKPIKYIAVPPEEVLERVKKKISEETEKQLKTMEDLRQGEVIDELKLLHTQGIELVDPTDISGCVKGRKNLYDHLESAIKKAESSIILMTTAKGFIRKSEALKSALSKAKSRGVKIRIGVNASKEIAKKVQEMSKIADIRQSDIKARFCLVDGKEVTFMLLNDEEVHSSYDVGVWVNSKFFASALEALYESEWKKMKAVE
ncbi:TrmB family transcriptional regulator [Candidatus Woesearchaeota archaeon]|nr:TrmB family transcriptional regulator [Candidatus Woesearchaeota archaeon]